MTAPSLRDRQAPLKTRYEADPASAQLTIAVRSATAGDDPMRCRIVSEPAAGQPAAWDAAAHPMAGGTGELPCSGDLLLASLAACQEITLRMVAAAMGIALRRVEITVEGDMDFRGTMGIDPETPVGFQRIRTEIAIDAGAPADRLERLARRAERYCVVASTLRQPPELSTEIRFSQPDPASA
ncbi:MAG TPA: OsmC family protein [Thermomicrobiales bacterium]|nr:OsmC family protein [Thermomicrobiales bacterium]